MSDLGLRIVEVEPAPCSHLHVSNYDPAKVVQGEPIQVLGNGQMWCYDCKEFFTLQVPPRRYTLEQIEALAREFLREKEINADDSITALALSRFFAWLARREREWRA